MSSKIQQLPCRVKLKLYRFVAMDAYGPPEIVNRAITLAFFLGGAAIFTVAMPVLLKFY